MINSPKHNEFVQHPDWNRGIYYETLNALGSGGNIDWGVMDPVMPYYNGMSNLWYRGASPVNSSVFPTYYSPIYSRVYNSKIIYQTYEVNRTTTNTIGTETFFSAPFFTTKLNDTVFTKGAIKFARCLIQFINIGEDAVQGADINFVVELLVRFKYIYSTVPSPRTNVQILVDSKNLIFPSELPSDSNFLQLFNLSGTFPQLNASVANVIIDINNSTYLSWGLRITNQFYSTDHCFIKTFVELR